MFIIRFIIYITPLIVFPYVTRKLWKKDLYSDFTFFEYVPLAILTGLSIFVLSEFLLLQFYKFNWLLLFDSLILACFALFLLGKITNRLFSFSKLEKIHPLKALTKKSKTLLFYLGLFGTFWYMATAINLFNSPPFWWDEIIHWVPKAKVLIESGVFSELNNIPFPEYPRFWPLILADFMLIQDKLTQLVPLILYYVYWLFAILVALRLIDVKKMSGLVAFSLVVSGAFMNIGWGAPYADLPLSVFYSTALVVLFLILDGRIRWINSVYAGVLLGCVSEIRTEGIMYSLLAIIIFTTVGLFKNKINAIKSVCLLVGLLLLFYLPWQIYIANHGIVNANMHVAIVGFNETWNHWDFMLQKGVHIFMFMWQEIGKVSHPYFILALFAAISIWKTFRKIEKSTVFSLLIVLGNFGILFFIILFSPILSGGYGGLEWWLQADFTRFTNHYLPFVFFISGVLLSRLVSKKDV